MKKTMRKIITQNDEELTIDLTPMWKWLIFALLGTIIIILWLQQAPLVIQITENVESNVCECKCICEEKECLEFNNSFWDKYSGLLDEQIIWGNMWSEENFNEILSTNKNKE